MLPQPITVQLIKLIVLPLAGIIKPEYMKNLICIFTFLAFSSNIVSAQQISLKKQLSQEDYINLDSLARSSFGCNPSFGLNFSGFDFYDNKSIIPDEPSSLKQIKSFEKKLKGNYHDASIYNSIGLVYKRLFMLEEAKTNFNKALELAQEYLKNNPDSSSAYDILGVVYLDLENFNEAGLAFQKAYALNSNDSLAMEMIPNIFLLTGNFDGYFSEIDKFINDHPNKFFNYIFLLMGLIAEKSSILFKVGKKDIEEILKNKSPDEFIDLSKIKNAYEKHNNDIQFELLYQFSKHYSTLIKSVVRTCADSSFSPPIHNFLLDDLDITELNKLEKFYLNCLTESRIPNKYILNKSLGNIYFLKGETALAIPYLEKAIKLKPLERSNFFNNAAEDYDNLASAFFWLKDTIAYAESVIEKIKNKPAINPLPEDYIKMSKISFIYKKYNDAIKYSNEALKINPNQKEAFICFSVIDILNRNFTEASQQLNKLYKIDPNSYEYYLLQGICQLNDNNFYNAYYSFKIARNLTNNPKRIDNEIINKYFNVKN